MTAHARRQLERVLLVGEHGGRLEVLGRELAFERGLLVDIFLDLEPQDRLGGLGGVVADRHLRLDRASADVGLDEAVGDPDAVGHDELDVLPEPAEVAVAELLRVRHLFEPQPVDALVGHRRETLDEVGLGRQRRHEHAHHQRVRRARMQRLARVEDERRVAALVAADRQAVEPHLGMVRRRAELDAHHAVGPIGISVEPRPIPRHAHVAGPHLVPHRRDADLLNHRRELLVPPFRPAHVARIKRNLPRPVQAQDLPFRHAHLLKADGFDEALSGF